MGYLDNEGLRHLWGEVEERSLASKALTQAEYDALLEEERANKVFLITDRTEMEVERLSLEEYDTDDGWHVRKWSNGSVEMSFWLGGIVPTSWEKFGDVLYKYNVNDYHGFEFPVKLIELYSEVASVSSPRSDRAPGWCYTVFPEDRLTASLITSIIVVSTITTGPYELNIQVTGRWK